MNIIDISTIIVAIIFLLIGFMGGFGRSLRLFTKGIVGIIISIFVCVAFGGLIMGIPKVNIWIGSLHEYFVSMSVFLGKIHLEKVVFYLAMFFAVQILRLLVVKVISNFFESDNKVMRVVNKVLGTIFAPTAAAMFLMLAFAIFALFEDTALIQNMLVKLDGTFLLKLYMNNPIVLV